MWLSPRRRVVYFCGHESAALNSRDRGNRMWWVHFMHGQEIKVVAGGAFTAKSAEEGAKSRKGECTVAVVAGLKPCASITRPCRAEHVLNQTLSLRQFCGTLFRGVIYCTQANTSRCGLSVRRQDSGAWVTSLKANTSRSETALFPAYKVVAGGLVYSRCGRRVETLR